MPPQPRYTPTPQEIEQATAEFRNAKLERKEKQYGPRINPSPAGIRVFKVGNDRDGMYLEPV